VYNVVGYKQQFNLKIRLVLLVVFICFSNTVIVSASDKLSGEAAFTRIQDFASGLTGFFDVINRKTDKKVANINAKSNNLVVLSMGFKQMGSKSISTLVTEEDDSSVEPSITVPLVYPNPFRQSTDDGAILSYDLSKDFSFEIHIYNMLAERVFKQTFEQGFVGAREGPNRLRINKESLGGYLLAAGVYFYVFVNENGVLAKGKMVVKP